MFKRSPQESVTNILIKGIRIETVGTTLYDILCRPKLLVAPRLRTLKYGHYYYMDVEYGPLSMRALKS